VHELGADSAAVDFASFVGAGASQVVELGIFEGLEQAEGVEVSLEISPAAEGFEDALAVFTVLAGLFCSRLGRLGGAIGYEGCTLGHKIVTSANLYFAIDSKPGAGSGPALRAAGN